MQKYAKVVVFESDWFKHFGPLDTKLTQTKHVCEDLLRLHVNVKQKIIFLPSIEGNHGHVYLCTCRTRLRFLAVVQSSSA